MSRKESYYEAGLTSSQKSARARARARVPASGPRVSDEQVREIMRQVGFAVYPDRQKPGPAIRARCCRCHSWGIAPHLIQDRARLVCAGGCVAREVAA